VQLVRVTLEGSGEPVQVRIHGDGLSGSASGRGVVEVPVVVEHPVVGERRPASVDVAGATHSSFDFVVAEPGWTMIWRTVPIQFLHYCWPCETGAARRAVGKGPASLTSTKDVTAVWADGHRHGPHTAGK
jgi:hypothetical protein